MTSRLEEYRQFLRQFREHFHTTGAVLPSSRWLARRLTWFLAKRRPPGRPVRILEVGPGTGAVTARIVRLMAPKDTLDLVELNDEFVATLERRFRSEPSFQRVAGQSRVHHCAIEEFASDRAYDFVISGLPFNNFSAELVERILADCVSRLAPAGVLSYFEYMFVRPIRMRLGRRSERQRLRAVDAVVQRYLEQFRIRRDWVFLNVPPAWVQHLQKPLE